MAFGLQWGRGSVAAEMNITVSSATWPMVLQWGRGSVAAEIPLRCSRR